VTERVPEEFSVEFELEIPAQLYVAQDQWRCLQVMSRLQSPTDRLESMSFDPAIHSSADGLRELALSIAHRMKHHHQDFARECLIANSLLSRAPSERQLARMLTLLEAVEDDVMHARVRLEPSPADSPEVVRERTLVAEFVSNQLLEFMFQARRIVDAQLVHGDGPHGEALEDTATAFECAVQAALSREVAYRTAHGFITATSDDPAMLEKYLERASLLKKHFHSLLFLHAETSSIDAQLRNWGAMVGAMLASMFGFILNKTGILGHWVTELGLVVAALIGAVVYTAQDRIKDLGKTMLPSKLAKRYAQRVTRLSVPARGQRTTGALVSTIEESVSAKEHSRPDPLNPEVGARRSVHVVRYISHGVVQAVPELRARGIVSLKQIFRYDLSWLFARLDDARKSVPVLTAAGVRAAHAPRCYRLPVRVHLVIGGHTHACTAIAVLHKGGLERLEPVVAGAPATAPNPVLARVY
jgi:hypothetical protein